MSCIGRWLMVLSVNSQTTVSTHLSGQPPSGDDWGVTRLAAPVEPEKSRAARAGLLHIANVPPDFVEKKLRNTLSHCWLKRCRRYFEKARHGK